jgi:cellulose synthase (UDP-forming)
MNIRIKNQTNAKYFYALSRSDAKKVRWLGVIGILAAINLIAGFYFFAGQSWITLILFGPLFLIVIVYNLINAMIMSQYAGFSVDDHNHKVEQYYKHNKSPRIAVMITAAGEDIEVVAATMAGAVKIEYDNYEVFVLDDSKPGLYKHEADRLGVTYWRRPNVGYHKKAGNLNSALESIKGFDHILVLDADFVPSPEILRELAPYTAPNIGIVQSPQHFELNKDIYKRSKFEYGAALIQQDFYRITQVARSSMGGAICVGTNALYNIKALKQVGGYEGVGRKDWGHSEDVFTGLKMLNSENENGDRYEIKYVPIKLAQGTCPSEHISFYKQQNRWATGSMQLIFSRKTLFSRKLSLSQKFCYFSNSVYYFFTIAMLLSPLQLFLIVVTDYKLDWQSSLLFLPSLLLGLVITPIVLRKEFKPIATTLVVLSNAYTFVQALILLIIKRPLGWEATGAKGGKKRNTHFNMFKILCSMFFIAIYVSTFAVLLMNQKITFDPSLIIVVMFIISFIGHVIYLHHMLMETLTVKRAHKDIHAYTYVLIFASTAIIIGASLLFAGHYKVDASYNDFISLDKK